jgi:hypothetical protein
MLAARFIFLVDEVEWISSIVIQSKKGTQDIRVCVDYWSSNSACVHDLFSTPSSDEVLDDVMGMEEYTFTNGFFRYHQVRITEENYLHDRVGVI